MTLLARIAGILATATKIVLGVSPLLAGSNPAMGAVVPTLVNDLARVSDVIVQVETVAQALKGNGVALSGDQKLVAATPAVAQIILQSSLVAGHKIANEDLFKAGSAKIASGMADILNSLHEDGVKTQDMKA